jgi:bacterioferritin-associated ferredoxin
MIVCSCNVLTDSTIKATLTGSNGATCPRTPGAVYKCLGCSPNCGRCLVTVRKIIDEALAGDQVNRADESCQTQGLPDSKSPALAATESPGFTSSSALKVAEIGR